MESFEDLLRARLAAPIKDKTGRVIINQDTREAMTAMEAMVMSVVNNAMKGDIASIAFIRNFSKQPDQNSQLQQQMEAKLKTVIDSITKQLQGERLYDGQDSEIAMLAETQMLVDKLTEQMHQADYEPTITEYRRDGSTQTVINPLTKLRDEQQDRFRAQLDKLRKDALNRILNKRNMKL